MDYPIKVLVLITELVRGGAETMALNYMRHIDREKIQFDFLINREKKYDYEDEIKSLGGTVYRMCPMYPQYFSRYKKEFKEFLYNHPEYKIIHSNLEDRSYFPLKIAKKMDVPVRIAHAHSAMKDYNLKAIVRFYFRKKLKPCLTHMFTCGIEAGDWLYGKKYRDSFVIMNNAIDTQLFKYSDSNAKAFRNLLGIDDKLVVGHVGRFNKVKNHKFLIRVFEALHAKNENSVLLLIGEGEEKESIKRYVDELKLTNSVHFLGSRDDVNLLMQAMDIFVLPSLFEGLPLTIVEAQCSGLPCIISDEVPEQCMLTDLVNVCSLQDLCDKWAEQILKTQQNACREKCSQIIEDAGYDIRKQAEWLQNLYISSLS